MHYAKYVSNQKLQNVQHVNRWMDDLRFYVFFNSISVLSGQWDCDSKRLYAMEPRLRLKRSPPQVGLKPGTARSVASVSYSMMHKFRVFDVDNAK